MVLFRPLETPPSPEIVTAEDEGRKLCGAICDNNWSRAREVIEAHPRALTAPISVSGTTPLHVAALLGHVTMVRELVKSVGPKFLGTGDAEGNTPLCLAAATGAREVAKCLTDHNPHLLCIPNSSNQLPLTLALLNGHLPMARSLYSATPLDYLSQPSPPVSVLLRCSLQTQCFGKTGGIEFDQEASERDYIGSYPLADVIVLLIWSRNVKKLVGEGYISRAWFTTYKGYLLHSQCQTYTCWPV